MGGRRERIEITLYGGRPWGFSIKGGLESSKPLIVSKVEAGGKAERSGLCVGDSIFSVNNVRLSGMRSEAIKLVKTSGSNLVLEVERGSLSNGESWAPHHQQKQSEPYHAMSGYELPYQRSQVPEGYHIAIQDDHTGRNPDHRNAEGRYFTTERPSHSAAAHLAGPALPSDKGFSANHDEASHLGDITNMLPDEDMLQDASVVSSSLPGAMSVSSSEDHRGGKRRSDEDRKSWNSLSSHNASSESLDQKESHVISQGPAMRHRRPHHNRNTERPSSWHASKHCGVDRASLSPTSSSPTPTFEDKRMRFPGDDGFRSPHHVSRSTYYSHSQHQSQSRRKSKGWTESGDLRSTLKGDINGSKDSILSCSSRQSNRSSRLSCSSSKSSGNMSGSRGSIDNLDTYYVPDPHKSFEVSSRKSPAAVFPQHARKSSSPSDLHAGNVSSKKYLFEKLSHSQQDYAAGKVGETHPGRRSELEDSKGMYRQQRHLHDSESSHHREEPLNVPMGDGDNMKKISISSHLHLPPSRKGYQPEGSVVRSPGDTSDVNVLYADAKVVTSPTQLTHKSKSPVGHADLKAAQLKQGLGSQLPVFAHGEPELAAKVFPVHPISPSIATPVTEDLKVPEVAGGQERLYGLKYDGKSVVAKTITMASPQRSPISSPVLGRAKQDKAVPRKSSTSPSRYEYLSDAYSGTELFPHRKSSDQVMRRMDGPYRTSNVSIPNKQADDDMLGPNNMSESYFRRSNMEERDRARASGRYGEVWKTPQIARKTKYANGAARSDKQGPNTNANNSKLSVYKPSGDGGTSMAAGKTGGDGTAPETMPTTFIKPSLDPKSRKPIYQSSLLGDGEDEISRGLGSPEPNEGFENPEISTRPEKKILSPQPKQLPEAAMKVHHSEREAAQFPRIINERMPTQQTKNMTTYGATNMDEAEEDDAFNPQNEEYTNHIKGMSKKVLRVTSFTRKDLELSPSFRMFEQQRHAFEIASRLGAAKEEQERSQLAQYIHRRSKSQGNDLEESTPVLRPCSGTGSVRGGRVMQPTSMSDLRPKSAGVKDYNHRVTGNVDWHTPKLRQNVMPLGSGMDRPEAKSGSLPRNIFASPLSTIHHVANKTSPEHRRVEIEVKPGDASAKDAGKSKPSSAIARRLAQNRAQEAHMSKMDARNAVLGFYFKKTGKGDGNVKKTSRAKSMSQFPQPLSPVNNEPMYPRTKAGDMEDAASKPRTGPMRAKSTSSLLDVDSVAQLSVVSMNDAPARGRDQGPPRRTVNDFRSSSMENLTADSISHPAQRTEQPFSAKENLPKPQVVHRSVFQFSPTKSPQAPSPPESTAKAAPFMYQLLQSKKQAAASMNKNQPVNREDKGLNHSSNQNVKESADTRVSSEKGPKPGSPNQSGNAYIHRERKSVGQARAISPKTRSSSRDSSSPPVNAGAKTSPQAKTDENPNRQTEPLPQAPMRRRRKKGQASLTSSSSSSSDTTGMSPARKGSITMTKKVSTTSIDTLSEEFPLPPPPPPPDSSFVPPGMKKKRSSFKIPPSSMLELPPPPPPPPEEDETPETPKKSLPDIQAAQVTPAVADIYREETYLLGTDDSSEGDPASKRNSRNVALGMTDSSAPAVHLPDVQLPFPKPEVLPMPFESADTVLSSESQETVVSQLSPRSNDVADTDNVASKNEEPEVPSESIPYTQGILSSMLEKMETGYRFGKSTASDVFMTTPSDYQPPVIGPYDTLPNSSLPVSSTYYQCSSASKAKIMHLVQEKVEGGEIEEDTESEEEINRKKMELVASIYSKMSELRKVKDLIKIELKENEELGSQVQKLVKSTCTNKEREKYSTFVEEVDKIINLILSISGRLARVENALSILAPDAEQEERSSLLEKREKLSRQQEEADTLKQNVDNRQKAVSEMLSKYLNIDQFTDYEHYITMKMTLIMEKRELDDKMKLGEEQMQCLRDSLPDDYQRKLDSMLEEQPSSEVKNQAGEKSSAPCPTTSEPG